jgi:hypothetical protein
MRRSLRYTDAVKVLAGGENQLVGLLDDASAAMLLGAGVFDLFEAREQALRLLEKVLDKFGDRLRGIERLTRTERIHAAHEIIRITAYFDAFGDAMSEHKMRFSAAEQSWLAAGTPGDLGWRELYEVLSQRALTSAIFDATSELAFQTMSNDLEQRLRGLAAWDVLDETEQSRLVETLAHRVPGQATARYQEYLRRLAVDCPEFGVWLNLQAHAATRDDLATGLADLEHLLSPLAAELGGNQQHALARAYRAALAKPIVLSGADSGLALPSLGEGYVNHRFRLAFSTLPDFDWEPVRIRHDLPDALGAYLMSKNARTLPLLILGQPGSGKSVLTRILAARLPADRFLPIRVELRRVDADADLQDHIESAIRDQTGEQVRWTRFVAENPDLQPVVILDGFDELLQATGVVQSDFLLRIERFQERELDQGRSVAVIVTSRTAVADRATLPDGSPVIRLEPFDGEQVAAWIDIWNRTNSTLLAERGVKPLSHRSVEPYRTLAEQPLLLLMLALYDAADNALTAVDPGLDRGAVYERLLREFARRELTKDPDITDLDRRIELELRRLSIVAFAMFNRGTQWIDAESLTEDLRALGIWEADRDQRGLRSALSTGHQMVGRFFFVHDSQATLDGRELQTYEFLHATFSEYLIARLVDRLLVELAQQHLASVNSSSRSISEGMLYALLSFDCLAARAPIVEFLGASLARHEPDVRTAIFDVLLRFFRGSLDERGDHGFADYQPRTWDVVKRASHWSANLVLLMAFDPDGITARQLYPRRDDLAILDWHRLAKIWHSSIRGESWNGLVDSLIVERVWRPAGRDAVIRAGRPSDSLARTDLTWSYYRSVTQVRDGMWWDSHTPAVLSQRANFLMDRRMDLAVHNTLPIAGVLPAVGHTVYHTADDRLVTATALLTAALAAPYAPDPADAAIGDLLRVLPLLDNGFRRERERYIKLALSVFITAVELDAVAADTRHALQDIAIPDNLFPDPDPQLDRLVARLTTLLATEPAPPAPATSPYPEPSPAASSPETSATPPAAP